jgi:hypothetical protein
LPYLLDRRRVVRDYEMLPAERTPENPLGLYKPTSDRIRFLPEEEVIRRRLRTREQSDTGQRTRTWA